jgi:hypothetical protein
MAIVRCKYAPTWINEKIGGQPTKSPIWLMVAGPDPRLASSRLQ